MLSSVLCGSLPFRFAHTEAWLSFYVTNCLSSVIIGICLGQGNVFCCCCLSSGSLVCCVFTCITFLMVNWFLAHAKLQRFINISSVIFTLDV